jgi:hypothetical protein
MLYFLQPLSTRTSVLSVIQKSGESCGAKRGAKTSANPELLLRMLRLTLAMLFQVVRIQLNGLLQGQALINLRNSVLIRRSDQNISFEQGSSQGITELGRTGFLSTRY